MKLFPLAFAAVVFVLPLAAAESPPPPLPGHSMHGEAFDEGPRQAALLMKGTGDVHFPITAAAPDAQAFFDQGVGQLHGFWYYEAERSFRQVAALDPECAMAYWGMAMANVNNPKRAAAFMKDATKRREKASRREQLWIDSLAAYHADSKKDEKQRREALVNALENLSDEFPKDIEAKAFLVLQIWDNSKHGVPLASKKALDALANEVLAASPMHPGIHHYRIHLWNGGNGDKRALESAACCGQTAPAIAHLWHMSGHTYSNLKRYTDAAWQQEASARVDHAYMKAARIMPDQIHNFAHNNDWLVQNLGYVGRVHDAIDLARNMIELPRLGPADAKSHTLGCDRLIETLVKYELWDEIAGLESSPYLAPRENATAELARLRALGIAHWSRGDRAAGGHLLGAAEAAVKKARDERVAAADAAEAKAREEKKSEDDIAKAMATAMRGFASRIDTARATVAELELYRALADGKIEDAKKWMEKTRDIGADRQALLWLKLGDKAKAEKLAREAIEKDDKQASRLANLAWVLWEIGKKDDARATFRKLRAISGQFDLEAPPFARLQPIAQDLALPEDWREKTVAATDVGQRPALESLGPFRWSPYRAPVFSLPDGKGATHSLLSQAGRPTLVIFYLGHGCTHCVEQLNAFAPLAKDYAAAGVAIMAISSDAGDALQQTMAKAKGGDGFSFPILADPALESFRAYRAYDDFERQPLHGTFLIDGAGMVRWQNIAHQPFRDAKWLLGECKRLLRIPPPAERVAGAE